jgi:hypothetical protein
MIKSRPDSFVLISNDSSSSSIGDRKFFQKGGEYIVLTPPSNCIFKTICTGFDDKGVALFTYEGRISRLKDGMLVAKKANNNLYTLTLEIPI